MIPQHIYDAIIESPAGKMINRLIADENLRRKDGDAAAFDAVTFDAHGSIIDQLYETITTAQKKYRRDRAKEANQDRLQKYQAIAEAQTQTIIHEQKPTTVQWSALGDFMSWEPTDDK